MEKNKPRCVLLGVQKRKKFTKENRLVKKVVDYLKSNCYMFAPVLSSPPSHFGSPNISISSSTGMKVRGTSKGRKKGLLKKVGDYLKSDSYFYSSIVDPQPRPPTGKFQNVKKVTVEVSRTTLIMNDNQPTLDLPNVVAKDQPFKCHDSETSTSDQQALGHQATVKHRFYKNCRCSSVPGHIPCHMESLS